jgi:tRNA nucleotidyltransferase (CCA-adding enzyme)
LKNGIARTPLPPDQTFIDDPLRILRAIRFVSRFDLKIDPNMAESFAKHDIRVYLSLYIPSSLDIGRIIEESE